jgi:uncharacterized membrane protein
MTAPRPPGIVVSTEAEDVRVMMLVSLIATVFIAAFAWMVYRGSAPVFASNASEYRCDPVDGAIARARRKLASGEITVEDFERIVHVLRD